LTLRTNLGRSLAFSRRHHDAITTLQAVANSPSASKTHRKALAMAQAAAGNDMIGELVRSDEPGARGTGRRNRSAGSLRGKNRTAGRRKAGVRLIG